MAAFVTEGTDALQVALAHLFFNITGILIWYPLPYTRALPLYLARRMGKATRLWKGFPIVYILVVFIGIPLGLLGLSNLFGRNQTLTVIGSLLVVGVVLTIAGCVYWLRWKGGSETLRNFLKRRQKNSNALETLPYDVHYIQRRIKELQKHTLCPSSCQATVSKSENWLANVSDDMELAYKKVELLARDTGLPLEEDLQNLGRFWHKKTEAMDDIEISQSTDYEYFMERGIICSIILGLLVSALLVWGLVVLFSNGSTGYTAMGGLIASVLFLFALERARNGVRACTEDGIAKRLESYKDETLREMYTKNYGAIMAQIKTDLETLESHTQLEASKHSAGSMTKGSTTALDISMITVVSS